MEESLFQDVLLDHFKRPRRGGVVSVAFAVRSAVNPACGDRVELTLGATEDRLDVGVGGTGCVVSQASASMMAQALRGAALPEARRLARAVVDWIGGRGPAPDFARDGWEDVEALSGVRRHPARAKCAALGWTLFLEATEGKTDAVD